MIAVRSFGLVVLVSCLAACVGRPAATSDAMVSGDSLAGWTKRGGAAEYTVGDSVITGETRPNTPNTFLCTERTYRNFVLELEFNVDAGLNSGVQIRSESRPEYRGGAVHGYQVEIDPSARGWTGGIYDESRRGWLASPSSASRVEVRPNNWNSLRVEADGPRIRTWVNGVPVADLMDGMTAEGFIALQVHDVGKRTDPLRVRWRNLRIRELP